MHKEPYLNVSGRLFLVYLLLVTGVISIIIRLIYLHTIADNFLKKQGAARTLRTVIDPSMRGDIIDRNGNALAVSAPVYDVWMNPIIAKDYFDKEQIIDLARLLGKDATVINAKLQYKRKFIYLKRFVSPQIASKLISLELNGVYLDKNYRRYYPNIEVTSHLTGFTNVDGLGQEGIEQLYNKSLAGSSGKKTIIKDLRSRVIKEVSHIKNTVDGDTVHLSIDKRIQYFAYRYLKAAVKKHHAKAGSAVVLDSNTGEVLAIVNQPSYNPNSIAQRLPNLIRNRAITDIFEPGSSIKPFTVALAIDRQYFSVNSKIDVSPGWLKLDKFTIYDANNYGIISIPEIITKSSNIGIAKIMRIVPVEELKKIYKLVGFGTVASKLIGENPGSVHGSRNWSSSEKAAFAYGYGLAINILQLAKAYMVLANYGLSKSISFVKNETTDDKAIVRVISKKTSQQVLEMLRLAVEKGTGTLAKVKYYQVGGKTGTVRAINKDGKYSINDYNSIFVGIAPISKPKLVIAVIINEPKGEKYHGGRIAAPVFSRILSDSLRVLNIKPDNIVGNKLAYAGSTP